MNPSRMALLGASILVCAGALWMLLEYDMGSSMLLLTVLIVAGLVGIALAFRRPK